MNLFREAAIKHQTNRLHGVVLVLPKTSHVLATVFIVLWLVITIAWLVSSQYARHATVSGWLEFPAGVVKIFAQSGHGRIQNIFVEEGQVVQKGQALLMIATDKTLASGYSLENTMMQEYTNQQSLLEKQLETLSSLQRLAIDDNQLKLAAKKRNLIALGAQINTLEQRQVLLNHRLVAYQNATANGHIANIDVERITEQHLALQNEHQAHLREKINLNNQIRLLESESVRLPNEYRNNVNQLHSKLSEIALLTAQLRGQQEFIIKASRDGVVSNLTAKNGQPVQNSTPLMTIVPKGGLIGIKLLVPVKAAGFVEEGQPIDVRYDAFPFQKFGLYQGEITQLTRSITLPQEAAITPVTVNEPVYLASAVIHSQYVDAYGKQFRLKPGMTLSADIELGQRSLLEWVLEPIFSLRGRI